MKINTSGFNLTELIVVLVIVVVVVALAIPQFTKPKEAALDREAQIALRQIQAMEKLYYMKQGFYYPHPASSDIVTTADINSVLRLNLNVKYWLYGIEPDRDLYNFTATAFRSQYQGGRTWEITNDSIVSKR